MRKLKAKEVKSDLFYGHTASKWQRGYELIQSSPRSHTFNYMVGIISHSLCFTSPSWQSWLLYRCFCKRHVWSIFLSLCASHPPSPSPRPQLLDTATVFPLCLFVCILVQLSMKCSSCLQVTIFSHDYHSTILLPDKQTSAAAVLTPIVHSGFGLLLTQISSSKLSQPLGSDLQGALWLWLPRPFPQSSYSFLGLHCYLYYLISSSSHFLSLLPL